MSYLEKSILSTIVYYNNLGQPLTMFEIYKYLIKPRSNEDVFQVLREGYSFTKVFDCLEKSDNLKSYIGHLNGFYFLKGRGHLVHRRIVKNRIGIKKWKTAKGVAKILQALPFIRMIAVSGSLAVNNTKKKSDIDLLIVVRYQRIWLTRALITIVIHLLRKRRHKHLTTNRFCLNHYITTESLHIPFKSLYNAQTYARLGLIYQKNEEDIYSQFQQANEWIKSYLLNVRIKKNNLHTIHHNFFLTKVSMFLELLLTGLVGGILEKGSKLYQVYRIKNDPLTFKTGGRVTFNDSQLEFHPDSPELGIIEAFNKKTFELGLLEYTNQKNSGLAVS